MDKDPIMDVDLNVSYDENSSEDDEPKKETKLIESTTLENEICRKLSEINKNNEIAVVNVGEGTNTISIESAGIESVEEDLNKFNKLLEYKNRLLFFSGMNKSLGLEAINLMSEDTYNLRKEQYFTSVLTKTGYNYTLESINSNLVNLWKKIIEFIKKIWSKIISFFKKDKNNKCLILNEKLTKDKKEVAKLQNKSINIDELSLLSSYSIYPLNDPKETWPQINNLNDLLSWSMNSNKDINALFNEILVHPHPYIIDLVRGFPNGGAFMGFYTGVFADNISFIINYVSELLNSYNVVLDDLTVNKGLTETSKEAENFLNKNFNISTSGDLFDDGFKSPKRYYYFYKRLVNKLNNKIKNEPFSEDISESFNLLYKSFFTQSKCFIRFFDDGLRMNDDFVIKNLNSLCEKIKKAQDNLSNINLNDQIDFDVSKLAEWSNYILDEFNSLNILMNSFYDYSDLITATCKKFYTLLYKIGNNMKENSTNMNWNENGKRLIDLLRKS